MADTLCKAQKFVISHRSVGNRPMTDDKLYTSLSANTIMAKLTNQFQRTRHTTSSPDKQLT